MEKRLVWLLAVLFFLTGCMTIPTKLSKLKLGASKDAVKRLLGDPDYTTAAKGPTGAAQELWEYAPKDDYEGEADTTWILYSQDNVIAWGRSKDFENINPKSILSLSEQTTIADTQRQAAAAEKQAEKAASSGVLFQQPVGGAQTAQ